MKKHFLIISTLLLLVSVVSVPQTIAQTYSSSSLQITADPSYSPGLGIFSSGVSRGVKLNSYLFQNYSSSEAVVTSVEFVVSDLLNNATVTNVFLFDQSANTNFSVVGVKNGNTITFTDPNGLFRIGAGKSKIVGVKVNASPLSTGLTVSIALNRVIANQTISAQLPITSITFKIDSPINEPAVIPGLMTLTGILPPVIRAGEVATLVGKNLDMTDGLYYIEFIGQNITANPLSGSGTELSFYVPTTLPGGTYEVRVVKKVTNEKSNTMLITLSSVPRSTPTITSFVAAVIERTEGRVLETNLTFSSAPVDGRLYIICPIGSSVTTTGPKKIVCNGEKATIYDFYDSSGNTYRDILFPINVPAGTSVTLGFQVFHNGSRVVSEEKTINLIIPTTGMSLYSQSGSPVINTLFPVRAIHGGIITVTGSGFDGTSYFDLVGERSSLLVSEFMSPQQVAFVVPQDLSLGLHTIRINASTNTVLSNTATFTVVDKLPENIGTIEVLGQTNGVFTRNLWLGVEGSDVTKLQKLLKVKVTGYFGAVTKVAVQNFQCKYNIVCAGDPNVNGYGVVGSKTRAKLEEIYGGKAVVAETAILSTTTDDRQALINTLKKQIEELQRQISKLLQEKVSTPTI